MTVPPGNRFARPASAVSGGGAIRPPSGEERRRTQRVLISIPVVIHRAGKPTLQGRTVNVSAGGALVSLQEPLSENAKVTIENPGTKDRVEGWVVRSSQVTQEGAHVAVEFSSASPNFWHISFPPTSGD